MLLYLTKSHTDDPYFYGRTTIQSEASKSDLEYIAK